MGRVRRGTRSHLGWCEWEGWGARGGDTSGDERDGSGGAGGDGGGKSGRFHFQCHLIFPPHIRLRLVLLVCLLCLEDGWGVGGGSAS